MSPKPNHVLFITDAFYPESGGVERVCLELGRALIRKGVRVSVLAQEVAGRPAEEDFEGFRVYRYPHGRRFAPLVYFSHWRNGRAAALYVLEKDRPDIAHCHLALSAQGPMSLFRSRGLPFVAGFYGPWHEEFSVEAEEQYAKSGVLYRTYLDLQNTLQKKMQRRLLRYADGVVVLSDFSREELLRLSPDAGGKIVKIPGGVDAKVFHPADHRTNEPPILFTVRRLVRRMGVDLLIEAVAQLHARGQRVRLIVAGQGPMRPALENLAHKLGIAEAVEFAGFVDDERLAEFYRSADLFVLPTRAQENFGLPIVEAAACGCPVVATPVGSIPELMRAVDSPYLCADAGASSLAETIERALAETGGSPSSRAEKAERTAAMFSWDRIAEGHIEHYGKVLSCASC